MTYTVVSGLGPHALTERVNRLASEGWLPLGGPVLDKQGFWYQAMKKWNDK